MARHKKITTEELVHYLTLYISKNPLTPVKLTVLAEYIRASGVNIDAYLIRRDKDFMEKLKQVNSDISEKMLPAVAVFQPLDVDDFLTHNTTLPRLRAALTERDCYYASVVKAAKEGIQLRNTVKAENEELADRNDELAAEVERLKQELQKYKANAVEVSTLSKKVSDLQRIIKMNVNPEIANALLVKAGLIKETELEVKTVSDERLEELTVSANTDIKGFSVKALNSLRGEFTDDD